MKNFIFLDEMKENLLSILHQRSTKSVDIGDMAIDYQQSLEDKLVKQLSLLEAKAEFFAEAKKNDDEIAMKAFLFEIRIHAMSLSSFFDAITEDTTLLLRTGEWPEIPENYQPPERYSKNRNK